jgi:hypothetical protein
MMRACDGDRSPGARRRRLAQEDAHEGGREGMTHLCFVLFDRTPLAWKKVDAMEPAARRVRQARGVRAFRRA